jgi:hypothetical protein
MIIYLCIFGCYRRFPDLVDAQYTKNQAWKSDADTLGNFLLFLDKAFSFFHLYLKFPLGSLRV